MDLWVQIIVLFVLLCLSGYFSASEIALVSLSDAKVRQLFAQKRWTAAYIKRLKDKPQRMLSTILIGNNVVNTAAAAIMTSIAITVFDSYAVGIATGIATILILIFGEITPKTIAARYNILLAQFFAPPLWWLSRVLQPILYLLDKLLGFIFRIFGLDKNKANISKDEIHHIIAAAHEEGGIKDIERHLVQNVFRFEETTVNEIMIPRSDMLKLPSTSTVEDALELIARKKRSRIPIYDESRDTVVGVVYLKDLIAVENPRMRVTRAMQKPYFVPESKRLSDILRRFQKRQEHMAIVVDEHGIVVGLVTLEDVLEEIVGDIVDETERSESNIRKKGRNIWSASGKTPVRELNEKLGMRLDADTYDTLGGLVLQRLGRIPNEGDEVQHGRFRLRVERISGQRIAKVVIRKR